MTSLPGYIVISLRGDYDKITTGQRERRKHEGEDMKKKIVIIGCGFAGTAAADRLRHLPRNDFETILIDRRRDFHFLPLLPDMIGRRIPSRLLKYPLAQFAEQIGASYIQDEVVSIDASARVVNLPARHIDYDYLLVSPGSMTNFYGNDALRQNSHTFDSVEEVERILSELDSDRWGCFVITGGGYTGIELATNIWRHQRERAQKRKIVIIEKAPSVLASLPEWIRRYVERDLRRMKIEVITGTSVQEAGNDRARLSDGREFEHARVFWVAGVKTPSFCERLSTEKLPQGRIAVDTALRVKPYLNVFAAGDAAAVVSGEGFLRLSVQGALTQGNCAAANIIRSIRKKSLVAYRPFDLGYLVPVAGARACGIVLGANVKGLPAILLHYFFCILRSYGIKNRIGLMKHLLKGGQ